MDTNEIQRRLAVMVSAMLGKGKVMPEARLSLVADAEPYLSISWKKRNPVREHDRDHVYFRGDDIGMKLAAAEAHISEMPDADAERKAEFTERLASLIEMGNSVGIDVEFVNPLIEAMKRLSENVIEDHSSQ